MTPTLPRQPHEPLFVVQAYEPSTQAEQERWQKIRNRERYDAWRRKRDRITREPSRQMNIRPGWGVLRASRLSTKAFLSRVVNRYRTRGA